MEPIFDGDRRDVERLSIDQIGSSFAVGKYSGGLHRQLCEPPLRAAQTASFRQTNYGRLFLTCSLC